MKNVAELELLKKIAQFIMGYQVHAAQNAYDRSHNFGISLAATELLDTEENRELIEALQAYAKEKV
jgi:hypothetical protein